jgi:hypothetical protein
MSTEGFFDVTEIPNFDIILQLSSALEEEVETDLPSDSDTDSETEDVGSSLQDLEEDEPSEEELSELEKSLDEKEEAEGLITDHVKLYLGQMGEIPLFTRAEEWKAATELVEYRDQYIYLMFTMNPIVDIVLKYLRNVRDAKLRFDHTLDAPKKDLMLCLYLQGSLRQNIHSIEGIFGEHVKRRLGVVLDKNVSLETRREDWKKIQKSRCSIVRLVQDSRLRLSIFERHFSVIETIEKEVIRLRLLIEDPKSAQRELLEAKVKLRRICIKLGHSPKTFLKQMDQYHEVKAKYLG